MFDQFLDEARRNIEVALVFSQIALLVRLVEQQPLLRRESQRVFQALEDQIPVFATVTMGTQGRQCRRMRRIISKVEAAFEGQDRVPGILQAYSRRAQQTGPFPCVRRFRLELADARQVRQCRRCGQCHAPLLSRKF